MKRGHKQKPGGRENSHRSYCSNGECGSLVRAEWTLVLASLEKILGWGGVRPDLEDTECYSKNLHYPLK